MGVSVEEELFEKPLEVYIPGKVPYDNSCYGENDKGNDEGECLP